MLVKIHNSYRSIISLCDSDLIGKTFEEGIKTIFVNPNFFKGEEKTEKEAIEIIEIGRAEDYTFNIVGKEAVRLALKTGIIKQEGIQ